jgi:cell division protein FtsW
VVVWRAFVIAIQAEKAGNGFASLLAHGIGIWIGLQAFINMGVNMGLLPTKGLTLPLMSYGGSSMVVVCAAIALLLRVDHETRCTVQGLTASGAAASKRRGQRA